eukprot:m.854426 g.854426  ORF g.854426 m.854426 type:complete len:575 (+) comp59621_c0_seq4:2147-3871(+)
MAARTADSLRVKVLGCKNLHKTGLFSPDAYVQLQIAGQTRRTKTAAHHQNPDWNETFDFVLKDIHATTLKLEVFASKLAAKDIKLGEVEIVLDGIEELRPLYIDGELGNAKSGRLQLEMLYKRVAATSSSSLVRAAAAPPALPATPVVAAFGSHVTRKGSGALTANPLFREDSNSSLALEDEEDGDAEEDVPQDSVEPAPQSSSAPKGVPTSHPDLQTMNRAMPAEFLEETDRPSLTGTMQRWTQARTVEPGQVRLSVAVGLKPAPVQASGSASLSGHSRSPSLSPSLRSERSPSLVRSARNVIPTLIPPIPGDAAASKLGPSAAAGSPARAHSPAPRPAAVPPAPSVATGNADIDAALARRRKQEALDAERRARAEKLELSEGAETKFRTKSKAQVFDVGEDHSRIFKALNPERLAFQTIRDREEAEEEGSETIHLVDDKKAALFAKPPSPNPSLPTSSAASADTPIVEADEEEPEQDEPPVDISALVAEAYDMLKEKREERERAEQARRDQLRALHEEKKRKEQEAIQKEVQAIEKQRAEEERLKKAASAGVEAEARARAQNISFGAFVFAQ